MYYTDTPTRQITAFDFDPETGNISNRRTVVIIPHDMGYPDGMTIDSNDKLWVAHWGGGCVAQWDPKTGKLLKKIDLPAPHVTSCAFGGKNLDLLFITTARSGLTKKQLEDYPASGGLFIARPGAKGVPAHLFKNEVEH
jgi:sugar lactone lactonase YvrE